MAQLDAADVPPIPVRTHRIITSSSSSSQQSPSRDYPRQKALPKTPPAVGASSKASSTQTASPEVISSLISSLSDLSKPLPDPYDSLPGLGLSLPTSSGLASPHGTSSAAGSVGSFGVDYGAFSPPTHDAVQPQDSSLSLDELSASSPVIRTAPPPSGLSTLTAPKSPRSARSVSRDSGVFRSLIRRSASATNSRPSSAEGSVRSRNEDTQSLGNISVERGSVAQPELKRQRSSGDSWGKKLNRNSRGLMYMSSKELLRGREVDKKRSSVGSGAPGNQVGRSESTHSGVRADSFLAENPISEEPMGSFEIDTDNAILDTTRRIPNRDSSLRKTGGNAKRTSVRRSKRDSQAQVDDTILEEQLRRDSQRASLILDSMYKTARRSFLLDDYGPSSSANTDAEAALRVLQGDVPAPLKMVSKSQDGQEERHEGERHEGERHEEERHEEERYEGKRHEGKRHEKDGHEGERDRHGEDGHEEDLDSAPFPTVTQNRKRDEGREADARRYSGLPSPPPEVPPKNKRNSTRTKRSSTAQEQARPSSMERSQSTVQPLSLHERPDSASSIDNAVETYICSPRLSQRIKHPQSGRVICFSEVGDVGGSTVFCCVGMGLTRYITAFYDELASTLKLRLITLDRPGVGGSGPYTDGTTTPLSWPDDVYAICQALKITKFSILAHSAGAIYALATALRMPQHIRGKIHLLAPWIPPSQMSTWGGNELNPPSNSIPTSQRVLRVLPTPILKAVNSSFMSATSASITSSLPKEKRKKRRSNTQGEKQLKTAVSVLTQLDQEHGTEGGESGQHQHQQHQQQRTLAVENSARVASSQSTDVDLLALAEKERQSEYDVRLTHSIWAAATTNANPAIDLLVCLERQHTIGFRYVDITRPVVIHHGSRDSRVPVENVKWLGKSMKKCEVRVLEGEGHGLMASASVMGSVLMEISKEWDEWIRVTTGQKDLKSKRSTLMRQGSRTDMLRSE